MAVTHTTTTAEPDDPTYDVSADAWNQAHTTADGSFVAAKLAASATDKVFGRSTAGAGNGEEIPLTAFGRSLIDDAAASNARTTLGIVIGTDVPGQAAFDDHSTRHDAGGADVLAIDAVAGNGSMRTLGTGATQAAAGNHAHTQQLDYVAITANVNLTATTEGTAHTCITGTSQAYAAEPILIEVSSPGVDTPTDAAGRAVIVLLYDGATVLGRLATLITPVAALLRAPMLGLYRLTPTAATHQYIVKAYVTGGTGVFSAGSGGTGANLPAFIRVSRAT